MEPATKNLPTASRLLYSVLSTIEGRSAPFKQTAVLRVGTRRVAFRIDFAYHPGMDAVAFSSVEFATGHCSCCERDVLTYADFDDAGVERYLCVHCDSPIAVEMTKGSALSAYGYDVIEPSAEPRACGTGGCGSGRCGRS